jgi:hypothetical protein
MLYDKPSRANFVLEEVKSKDSASLIVKAHSVKQVDGVTTEVPYTGTYEIVPHSDLTDCFKELKFRLAQYFGYTQARVIVGSKDFKATKAQQKYMEMAEERLFEDIRCTGVSIGGKDRNKVVLKGTYKGCAINTKPMGFANEEYGEELEGYWERLEIEVYDYLFEDKKSNLEIVFSAKEPEPIPMEM